MRQATIALEVRRTLEVRHGDGIYLRTPSPDSGQDFMRRMTQRHSLPAILEAREALGSQLAALAAARRTDADVTAMESALGLMAADIDSGGTGDEGDRLFHEAVTRAARSPLLAELMAALPVSITQTTRASPVQSGQVPHSLRAHRRILGAIQRGDCPRARQAMSRHVITEAGPGVLR